jgi:hypothetical protein
MRCVGTARAIGRKNQKWIDREGRVDARMGQDKD